MLVGCGTSSKSAGTEMAYKTLYHGSDSKFGEFQAKRLGSGEGYHSYGFGFYFAESPRCAEFYGEYLYKVEVPVKMIALCLDWDYPLANQPSLIKKAMAVEWKKVSQKKEDPVGKDVFFAMGGIFDSSNRPVTVKLQKLGVQGVWYFDQKSRPKMKGTHNLVLFPGGEKSIRIVSRDGEPVTSAQLRLEARLAAST